MMQGAVGKFGWLWVASIIPVEYTCAAVAADGVVANVVLDVQMLTRASNEVWCRFKSNPALVAL